MGPAVGFDHDPDAVRVSHRNAAHNAVSARIEFFVGDVPPGLAGRRADLIPANFQADVLTRHAWDLARAIDPGGWLALSGILATELSPMRAAFASVAHGGMTDSRTMGEWAELLPTRPAGPAVAENQAELE